MNESWVILCNLNRVLNEFIQHPVQIAGKVSLGGFKEGPGAKTLLKTLTLFVRLKPHAPSGKAKTGAFIRLAGAECIHSAPGLWFSEVR
jgi:hypothetical protein